MKLRSHLVVLVLVVLVPVLIFSGVTAILFARHHRHSIEQGLRETARALALAVDRELTNSISTLRVLATSEHLAGDNLEGFYREAQAVLPSQEHWSTILLVDPTGQQRINLLRPYGAELPSAGDRPVFQEMLRTRRPAVSGLLMARVGGEPNVSIFVPVIRGGELRYAVAATLRLVRLSDTLLRQPLVSSGSAVIADRDHVIIAGTRGEAGALGQSSGPALVQGIAAASEGLLRGPAADGKEAYGAFARVPVSGWTTVLRLPAAVVEAPLARSMWGLLGGAAVSIALALLLAALFGRRIARPIAAVARSAERIGRGEAPQTAPSGIAEINEVAQAIEQTSALLGAHDAERERVRGALQQANHTLEALVTASPLGIVVLDAGGIVHRWNPACERIFGWTADEVVGAFAPYVPDDRLLEFHANVDATLRGRGMRGMETRRHRRGGTPVDISVSTAVLPGEDGRPAYVLAIIDDITDRRRADRHRTIQYDVSRVLAEAVDLRAAAPAVIEAVGAQLGWDVGILWAVDAEDGALRCVDVWTAADEFAAFAEVTRERTFGAGDGIPGHVWAGGEPAWVVDVATDAVFPRRHAAVHAGLHAAFAFPIALGGPVLGVMEFFSREPRPHDVALLRLMSSVGSQIGQFLERTRAEDGLARLLAAEQGARTEAETAMAELRRVQRITDAALAPLTVDELLRELLVRLRTVVHVDTAAVFLVDRERECLVLRAADGLETGVEREPIPLGKGFAGRIALGRDPGMADDLDHVELHASFLRERGLRSLLAAPLMVGTRVTGVIRVGSQQPRRFTGADARLLQLVADRAALAIENACLYEAERTARADAEAASRAKDQFLAMLAHELRNPLAPIRSAVHVIGRLATDPTVRRARDIVERQVAHLARLLDDLLDVARITRGKIELFRTPLDLQSVVAEAVEATRALVDTKGHTVQVVFPEGPIQVDADPTRLVQVVGNLVNNAAKYTPARGTIRITGRRDGDWVVLAVSDNGIGIPPEMLGRVFELFSQVDPSFARSEGGLGVGLTLVRSLVELHGGLVSARSEGKGRGSEFVVRLPAGIPQAVAEGAREDEARAMAPLNVLVVEDNADAAEMLRTALELQGHAVHVCGDGLTGVETARLKRPDLMLVDIGLPGLDGYEVAREVRIALGPGPILIAVTGFGQPEDRHRALAAGFDGHMVKPVEPTDVLKLVATLVR